MNTVLAPVILFTYKRTDNVKGIIKSLSNCKLSTETDVVVFSDSAKSTSDAPLVKDVRAYLKTVNCFKSLTVIERDSNLGVDFNIINGIKESSEKFDKFIILEDDLLLSSTFLIFMNKALNYYSNYPNVLSISGYSFLKSVPEYYNSDIYFANRSWSWGWATWSSKMKLVDWEVKDFKSFESDSLIQKQFNDNGGSDLTKMLKETMNGKIRAWDIRLFYHQFKNKLFTVYPVISKVINVGFNENGSNTFGYNRYKTILDNSNKTAFEFKEDVALDKNINRAFLKKNNLTSRIITRIFSMLGFH